MEKLTNLSSLIDKIKDVLYSNKYRTEFWRFEKVITPAPNLGFEKLNVEEIEKVFGEIKNIQPTPEMSFQEFENFLEKKKVVLNELNNMFKRMNDFFEMKVEIVEEDDRIYKIRKEVFRDLYGYCYSQKIVSKEIDERKALEYVNNLEEKIRQLRDKIWELENKNYELEECE